MSTPTERIIPIFVYFRPTSASVFSAPGEETAVEWLLRSLQGIGPQFNLQVLTCQGYEPASLRRVLSHNANIDIFYCSGPSIVEALYEASSMSGHEVFVYLNLSYACAPPGLLDALIEEHLRCNNWCTVASGLPSGISPIVFAKPLVEFAARVQALNRYSVPLGFSLENVFRRCVSVCQQTDYPLAKFGEYDVVERFSLDLARLPIEMDFDNADAATYRRLAAITLDYSIGPSESNLMYAWKEAVTAEQEANDWPSLGAINRPGHRPSGRVTTSERERRVLLVSNASAYSGAEDALCTTITALLDCEYRFSAMIALDGYFAQRLRDLHVPVRIVGREFAAPTTENARVIAQVLSETRPAIVHLNGYSGTFVAACAKLLGSALVYHLRLCPVPEYNDVLAAADRIIAVSHFVKDHVLRLNVDPGRVTVVYDGVDTAYRRPSEVADRAAAKLRIGADPHKVAVLMVGRYEASKRHDLLINAIAVLPKEEVELILVGESFGSLAYENYIRDLLRTTGVGHRVIQMGFQKDLRTVQTAADVYVLCSEREALGQSILEAMSMGIPVIAAKESGIAEIIRNHPNSGYILERATPDVLAGLLRKLITDSTLRAQVGLEARRVCEEILDARRNAALLRRMYDSVLA